MATKRKTLTKKTRFEVFKRDGFKCQYCGASAPESILVVDHIDPISKDGGNEMVNYITACQPCNAGKSDRKLDDSTTLKKQKAQLDDLNERREQLEMMMQWRGGLKDIAESEVDAAVDAWSEIVPGWGLNDKGIGELRKHIKKYGLQAVLDAFDVAKVQYVILGEEKKATSDSTALAWSKVGGILRLANLPDEERELYYVKGILRNRLSYVPYDAFKSLQYAMNDGVSVEDMKLEAKHARSWTQFYGWLELTRKECCGQG